MIDTIENKDILIIDDDNLSMILLSTYIKRAKANVFEAPDGCTAINMLKEHKFDIILMDMQMPRISGEEAVRRIRNELKLNTPIIMITALNEDFIRGIYGINDYIIKPFEPSNLIISIKSNL